MTAPLRAFRQIRSGEDVIHLAVRLGLLAFLIYWSFILVRPFVPILAWGAMLAVALYPAFDWLSSHLGGRPKLAATVVTALCLAIIIGPVAWLGIGLIDSLMEIYEQFGNGRLVVPSPKSNPLGSSPRKSFITSVGSAEPPEMSSLSRPPKLPRLQKRLRKRPRPSTRRYVP